eukprot:jgi/Mesvir1/13712/Mv01133-RA.1
MSSDDEENPQYLTPTKATQADFGGQTPRTPQDEIDSLVDVGRCAKSALESITKKRQRDDDGILVEIALAKKKLEETKTQIQVIATEVHNLQLRRGWFNIQKRYKQEQEEVERLENDHKNKRLAAADKLYQCLQWTFQRKTLQQPLHVARVVVAMPTMTMKNQQRRARNLSTVKKQSHPARSSRTMFFFGATSALL